MVHAESRNWANSAELEACGLTRASDTVFLEAQESRVFVTRSKDFGGSVFVKRLGKGVIYHSFQAYPINGCCHYPV